VSILPNLLLREPPGLGQQRIAFQAAPQSARFDLAGSQPDPQLGDEHQQGMDAHRVVRPAAAALPGNPDLHRVLEAQLARDLVREQGQDAKLRPDSP